MVLVEALDNRVSEELIVRSNALPLLPRPLHVLPPPSKAIITVHKAQYHLNPILPSLRYHEIQPLNELTPEETKNGNASAHRQRKRGKKRARTSQETTSVAKDLEGVLVVAAGGVLQRIAASAVVERPRPGHGEAGAGGLAQRRGDLVPLRGVGTQGHEPVGVEPVGEERSSVVHEAGALDPHERIPAGLCCLLATMDAHEQKQSKSPTKPHSSLVGFLCRPPLCSRMAMVVR